MTALLPTEDVFIHVVDVAHGDAIILELPVYGADRTMARFAIVDAGRPERIYQDRFIKYLESLASIRGVYTSGKLSIEFVCITHPHEDHYGSLKALIDHPVFGTRIRQFWDCGFRTNSVTYNKLLATIAERDEIVYDRIAAGFESELGEVRFDALAPSLDLRNRFDTFGVDRNNASVVLRVQYRRSVAILAGDAFIESWGKVLEEFPRRSRISYFKGAAPKRSEGTNQMNCQLLKVSHHGSKRGTSLEYLEKMSPRTVMVTCAKPDWYAEYEPKWGKKWPHPLFKRTIEELADVPELLTSGANGNVVFRLTGSGRRLIEWSAFDQSEIASNVSGGLEQGIRNAVGGTGVRLDH